MKWAREDQDKSLLDITVEAMRQSMVGIMEYLTFTVETGDDYGDGWLPSLDTSLLVGENNTILYKYFEKPTTTNTTIRRNTAMAENAKMQSLSNDLIRRLLNCKEGLHSSYRAKVIDDYGRKLRTSGYELEQTRRILLNGMKGYQSKAVRRKKEGGRIHRTAQESSSGRWRKKLIGKNSWFKGSKKDDEGGAEKRVGRAENRKGAETNKQLKTRAVLFVEQSPGGELAKQVRTKLQEMEPMLGFRLRVVERTGITFLPASLRPEPGVGVNVVVETASPVTRRGRSFLNVRGGVLFMKVSALLVTLGLQRKGSWRKL